LCGIGIAALFAIAAFVRNKAAVMICDLAALALSVITFLIPGILVHICLLSNMYCQSRLKPFARGSAIITALLALWDILSILKEIKEGGSGQEK
jgi:ABC-type nickel/cobalt efflux system permease component RcnA